MNARVSFEIAKLLKEKGFNEICQYLHHFNGSDCIKMPNKNSENFGFSAPTISEVVMWLYEKYEIWIEVINVYFTDFSAVIKGEARLELNRYKSPTEAYEAAIIYTLKNLI